MTDRNDKLRQSIGNLYRVFAPYHSDGTMARCDHCVTQDEVNKLTGVPLKDVSWDTVGYYSAKAMTTWGDCNDFKHFLPRILEAAALEDCPLNVEILGGKLRLAEWTKWGSVEQQAMQDYMYALWGCMLQAFPLHGQFSAFGGIDAAICTLGLACDDLSPFLDSWLEVGSAPPVRHLAEFVSQNAPSWAQKGMLWNAFWEKDSPSMKQAGEWMMGEVVRRHLEEGFFQFASKEFSGELSQAVEILEWTRGSARGTGTVS